MRIDAEHEFGTRECPSCGVEVPLNSNRCPICNYEFPIRASYTFSRLRWPAAILLIVLFLWMVF